MEIKYLDQGQFSFQLIYSNVDNQKIIDNLKASPYFIEMRGCIVGGKKQIMNCISNNQDECIKFADEVGAEIVFD